MKENYLIILLEVNVIKKNNAYIIIKLIYLKFIYFF